MIKTLTPHGNSAALIIDKAILEILNIDMSTPLEIVTDGQSLIISPVRDDLHNDRVTRALERVNARHSETLRRLAE
jgi:antitoxin MazE